MKTLYAVGGFDAESGDFWGYVYTGVNRTPAVYDNLASARRLCSIRNARENHPKSVYKIILLKSEKVLDI